MLPPHFIGPSSTAPPALHVVTPLVPSQWYSDIKVTLLYISHQYLSSRLLYQTSILNKKVGQPNTSYKFKAHSKCPQTYNNILMNFLNSFFVRNAGALKCLLWMNKAKFHFDISGVIKQSPCIWHTLYICLLNLSRALSVSAIIINPFALDLWWSCFASLSFCFGKVPDYHH